MIELEELKAEFYKLQDDKKKLTSEYIKSDTLLHEKMLDISLQIARFHIDEIGKDVKKLSKEETKSFVEGITRHMN